jgi:hypothetical protein
MGAAPARRLSSLRADKLSPRIPAGKLLLLQESPVWIRKVDPGAAAIYVGRNASPRTTGISKGTSTTIRACLATLMAEGCQQAMAF